jgi:orotidine-5'-phosphate decarboxylase
MKYNPIICAIDTYDEQRALDLILSTRENVGMVKVGLELFTSAGMLFMETLEEENIPVFLDLKFYDIPNTVRNTVRNFSRFSNIQMLTVHGSGDSDMIRAAVDVSEHIDVIAVTVLTSSVNSRTMDTMVKDITEKSLNAGAAGVVCSVNEAATMRKAFGNDFKIITPGIRPLWYVMTDDQRRIGTPTLAIKEGATHLVIGRPITDSYDVNGASYMILEEINEIRSVT